MGGDPARDEQARAPRRVVPPVHDDAAPAARRDGGGDRGHHVVALDDVRVEPREDRPQPPDDARQPPNGRRRGRQLVGEHLDRDARRLEVRREPRAVAEQHDGDVDAPGGEVLEERDVAAREHPPRAVTGRAVPDDGHPHPAAGCATASAATRGSHGQTSRWLEIV